MEKEAESNYCRIEVIKKRGNIVGYLGRIVSFLIGIFGILLGALCCLTLIDIIVGYPMILSAMGLIMSAVGYQKVECPACAFRNLIETDFHNFDCERCNTRVLVVWTDPGKSL
ncbi:DUF5362 family protein [Scopulibacillus cellulosilyticus]|uniref:DUF5362 family protein n=1 Tax=Scopulibacillus cellulosilyticus TaxID=2665665 RepID=A0ABW2PTP0_9BACL